MPEAPCPRCGYREVRTMSTLADHHPDPPPAPPPLEGLRLLAFLLWPVSAILLLGGDMAAVVLLAVLGIDLRAIAFRLAAASLAAAVLALFLGVLLDRIARRATPHGPDRSRAVVFCPWCETTSIQEMGEDAAGE